MRAIPFLVLTAGVCALDVVLVVGLAVSFDQPNPPNRLDLVSVLLTGIVGGFSYGLFLASRVTRSLEKTGVSRATRRRLLATLIAVVAVLFVYFWFSGFFISIRSPLFALEFSLLASMFAAQATAYFRWERRNAKSIEYDGVWGMKAVERNPVHNLTLEQKQ